MINREDILSMEYLKKTEYTGCHQGMRYRLEKKETEEGKFLLVTVWPEPFNYFTTPEEETCRRPRRPDDRHPGRHVISSRRANVSPRHGHMTRAAGKRNSL